MPVWGTAAANESLSVQFDRQTKMAHADKNGKWMVALDPQPAGGPYELTIRGHDSLVFRDVYVGEVWICSGQSNMEFRLRQAMNADTERVHADYPQIRQFAVARDQSIRPKDELTNGRWVVCDTATSGNFTAVGYFFARELWNRLHIAVGLINTSWGGTMIESWISRGAFEKTAEFKQMIGTMPALTADSIKPKLPNLYPTLLFNAMVNPLIPYGIRGVLWYQGETNTGRAYEYRQALPLLIADWRQHWNIGNFPFYIVQLSSFGDDNSETGSNWAELREAQSRTLNTPNTGIAVTTDIGNALDVHPKNKQDVGRRLAAIALNNLYGHPMQFSGPVFDSFKTDSDKVILYFSHVGGGLSVHDKYGYLKGFTVAGEDHRFHYAKAHIEGNTVVVYTESVSRPAAVRYAWADDAGDANLFNQEGFPAISFRTDQWKGETDDVKYVIGK